MKVIEKGRIQTDWAKNYLCTGTGNKGGGCGSKLLVEFGDLFRTYHNSCGERDTCLSFKCSECGVLTDIDVNDPPKFELIPDKNVWEQRQIANAGVVLHG